MSNFNEIREEVKQLQIKLADANKRLEAAGLEYLGLSIGDVIVAHVGTKRECLASVKGCAVSWGNPRVEAFKIKRDGTVGGISAGYIDEWSKP